MSIQDHHGTCLAGFSQAVAEAVAYTQQLCKPIDTKRAGEDSSRALEQLRSIYHRNVKKLFVEDVQRPSSDCAIVTEGCRDTCLERELGVIYGSLLVHLQAILASWTSYRSANNKLVNQREISESCRDRASSEGLRHDDLAADVVAQLMRVEAGVRSRAQLLAQTLQVYCRESDFTFYGDSRSSRQYSGHGVLGFYVASQTRKALVLHFHYWDGVDACYAGTGDLFNRPEDRKVLQALADRTFGHPVKFSPDFNTIELEEPVING